MGLKRVGILTGGGDCSGLNAVIRAVTRSAIFEHEAEVVGIENGFDGLIFDRYRMLSVEDTKEILPLGGTILGRPTKGIHSSIVSLTTKAVLPFGITPNKR